MVSVEIFVLKVHDQKPQTLGLNHATGKIRLPAAVGLDAEQPVIKKLRFDEGLPPLAEEDVDGSAHVKVADNLYLVTPVEKSSDIQFIGFANVPFLQGLFLNMKSSKPSVLFSTSAFVVSSNLKNNLSVAALAQSMAKFSLNADEYMLKNVFFWLHPGRAPQLLVIATNNRVIWASLTSDGNIADVGPPNGSFNRSADGSSFSVTFHHNGLPSANTTVFHKVCDTVAGDVTLHCATGGRTGNIIYQDMHISNQWHAIKDWAVCAIELL
jgi:hypothetical protein